MKILTIGAAFPDYQQDDLYHGLMQLDDYQIDCNVNLAYLFDDYPGDIRHIYGKGISYAKNIPAAKRRVVQGKDLQRKILSGYYDAVIYLSIHRCDEMLIEVTHAMDRSNIALVDGEDGSDLHESMSGIYFKRELYFEPFGDIHPISFAIPEEKLCSFEPIKLKKMSLQVPGSDRKYLFDTESEYYSEYRSSKFAMTMRKGGWDCKRHYEILANRCIPIFVGIGSCPKYICHTLPKDLLNEIEVTYSDASENTIHEWSKYLFNYTRDNLTTKKLAEYVLGKICG